MLNPVSNCSICLTEISPQPNCEEEKELALDCKHKFHRECIGEWLKQKHNCPNCRASVKVDTPEAPTAEMTLEEILAVPDTERLVLVRNPIREIRIVRQLNLNENTEVAQLARKVNSRIFNR